MYANMLDAIAHFNPIFQEDLTCAMRDPEGTHETFKRYLNTPASRPKAGAEASFTAVNDEDRASA